jgi:hypothetical protein
VLTDLDSRLVGKLLYVSKADKFFKNTFFINSRLRTQTLPWIRFSPQSSESFIFLLYPYKYIYMLDYIKQILFVLHVGTIFDL